MLMNTSSHPPQSPSFSHSNPLNVLSPTFEYKNSSCRYNTYSNYGRFNCNNFNIRYWSWNYRGCWHQTCPPIDVAFSFTIHSIQSQSIYPELIFLFTTSPNRDWVICAPAAILRCGSCFSGSLFGIKP